MYSITARSIFSSQGETGDLVYSDQQDLDEYKIHNASLSLSVNAAGSLQFVLPKCNACYNTINHMVTEIMVWRSDSTGNMKDIWRGRVLTEDKDFYNNRVLVCEGELAYLNDTIQPPNVYRGLTITQFIHELLVNHNRNVVENKKFYSGLITVDNNDTLYRYTDYNTTMECFQSLIDNYGGLLRIRHGSDGKRYIDYLDEPPESSAQEIRFGSNILDISRHFDLSEFATAVIPLGTPPEENEYNYIFRHSSQAYKDPNYKKAMITSELLDRFTSKTPVVVNDHEFAVALRYKEVNGVGTVKVARKGTNNRATLSDASAKEDFYPELEDRLTIESVNDGHIDLYSQAAVDQYGYICKVVDYDEITDPTILKAAGQLYLSDIQFDDMEIEVSALDLHYAYPEIDSFDVLDKVHAISQPHGMDKMFVITKVDIPFGNPENATVTLNGSINGKSTKISSITSGTLNATKSILGAKAYKPNKKPNT